MGRFTASTKQQRRSVILKKLGACAGANQSRCAAKNKPEIVQMARDIKSAQPTMRAPQFATTRALVNSTLGKTKSARPTASPSIINRLEDEAVTVRDRDMGTRPHQKSELYDHLQKRLEVRSRGQRSLKTSRQCCLPSVSLFLASALYSSLTSDR